MLGHLDIQPGLQDLTNHRGQQAILPSQSDALATGTIDELLRPRPPRISAGQLSRQHLAPTAINKRPISRSRCLAHLRDPPSRSPPNADHRSRQIHKEPDRPYENGCGYWASVAHGLEGAVVGAMDASGAGEEEAAGAAAEDGIGVTAHGAEKLSEREFTGADISLTKSGETLTQADGATVYLKEVSSGCFNVIVEGQRGVVTALKNITQSAVDRLSAKYGWH
jgi:hypothetical protein